MQLPANDPDNPDFVYRTSQQRPLDIAPKASTGIAGLDNILFGGLPTEHLYLVQGDPGSGKTTLALQFLLAGCAQGERCLYVTLSESRSELIGIAESHGWSLQGMSIFELTPSPQSLQPDALYTVFHPAEVELTDTLKALFTILDEVNPSRLVIDSLSELRLLTRDPLRYKRQILALKHYLLSRHCTALLLDDQSANQTELHVQSSAHGVLVMGQTTPEYGAERRRISVLKLRGAPFRGGYHDYTVRTGGITVFPRLIAAEHRVRRKSDPVSSGVPELDTLLGGGLHRGTSALIMGPAGSGKSTIALQYALAASCRGEKVQIYNFDEGLQTLRERAESLGLPVEQEIASGRMKIEPIDPAELSPGEFVQRVAESVEDGARVVVIDTLNGFLNAMPGDNYLAVQLHELLAYLSFHGVLSILVLSQAGVLGGNMQSPVDVSYLADSVLLLRFFEAAGSVRLAISVVKKRSGPHERSIRELDLGPNGLRLGRPLTDFHGVLTGVPSYIGASDPLLRAGNGDGANDGSKR